MDFSYRELYLVFLLAMTSSAIAIEDWYSFTGTNGVSIEAQLLEVAEDFVEVRVRQQGGERKVYRLPLTRFSIDSREDIARLWRERRMDGGEGASSGAGDSSRPAAGNGELFHYEMKGEPGEEGRIIHPYAPEELNEALGGEFFDENGFRDDEPDILFSRLELTRSARGDHSFWGSRFGEGREVFGVRARSVEIHGEPGQGTHRVSFLFSNQQSTEGKSRSREVREDLETLIGVLTEALGEPEEFRRFSPPDAELFLWRTPTVVFLLSHSRREFTFLDLFNAGEDGRVEYLRPHIPPLREAVVENGDRGRDVLLPAEIHRQGAMNCYPTIAALVMNQAGIPVNPYLVGAAVLTDDGGTFDSNLISGIREIFDEMSDRGAEDPFSDAGYRLSSNTGKLTFDYVVGQIDAGRAIFVSTYSMEGLRSYLDAYARLRTAPVPEEAMESEVRAAERDMSPGEGHAGAILGYNRERNEILYADPTENPGWMEFEVFSEYVQGLHFVVTREEP